ncbi:hypothetical protein KUTeg_015044 [Tegillarca granosa]|uniref:DDE-1 domain-containing protein n=1 Tax=Tegillarca granosa TaxID=220873 RepID=A0ABQ9EU76_TEGGR|nr:hypothetical protein KUTeg_015044 [Tegillarca granosa]
MIKYVNKVLVPYVDSVRQELHLPLESKALIVFDTSIYKAHRREKLVSFLGRNGIRLAYIPAVCTGQLQPLDLILNNVFKSHLKSNEIQRQFATGRDISDVSIDLRLSNIKPLHASLLVLANISMIQKAFKLRGNRKLHENIHLAFNFAKQDNF